VAGAGETTVVRVVVVVVVGGGTTASSVEQAFSEMAIPAVKASQTIRFFM
jgi:hypothetical protein